jgi:hypothetical protein
MSRSPERREENHSERETHFSSIQEALIQYRDALATRDDETSRRCMMLYQLFKMRKINFTVAFPYFCFISFFLFLITLFKMVKRNPAQLQESYS